MLRPTSLIGQNGGLSKQGHVANNYSYNYNHDRTYMVIIITMIIIAPTWL